MARVYRKVAFYSNPQYLNSIAPRSHRDALTRHTCMHTHSAYSSSHTGDYHRRKRVRFHAHYKHYNVTPPPHRTNTQRAQHRTHTHTEFSAGRWMVCVCVSRRVNSHAVQSIIIIQPASHFTFTALI